MHYPSFLPQNGPFSNLPTASNLGRTLRDVIIASRNKIDEVVTRDAQGLFSSCEWEAVVEGGDFHDGERAEWAMASVLRHVREEWAPRLYQVRAMLIITTFSDCFIDPFIIYSSTRTSQ